MLDPVFEQDGDLIVPSELARGPWDPRAQHGGPVAAALARAIERCDPSDDLAAARIAVDFLRPVPLRPLRAEARIARDGRRVQLVEASLLDGEDAVARASAWRLRVAPGVSPPVEPAARPPGPERGASWDPAMNLTGFWSAVEWRFVAGDFTSSGPATGWCRLRTALFAGEEPTPLQRVVAAADFGNGISAVLDFLRYVYINVDLAVHLHRLPAGEWIGLAAETAVGPAGAGLARGTLYDRDGPIGGSAGQLLVDRRPPG